MSWWDLISQTITSTILSAAAMAFLAAFFKDALRTWFTAKVKHDYDGRLEALKNANNQELEKLRNALSGQLENLKSDLRDREKELDALRAAAFSTRAARQGQLDKRRIEAVDQLWDAFRSLSAGRTLVSMHSMIKYDVAAEAANKSTRARDGFAQLLKGVKADKAFEHNGEIARPFVSPLAWALFSAYAITISFAQSRMMALTVEGASAMLENHEILLKPLKEALPDWDDFINSTGVGGVPYILAEIEKRLLNELQKNLQGDAYDKAEIEQAAKILMAMRDTEIAQDKARLGGQTPDARIVMT